MVFVSSLGAKSQRNIFDYDEGYDGSLWLLLLKDEYSGMVFVSSLGAKFQRNITETIQRFEVWVRRQYGLGICKIRQDNDTATISRENHSETLYEQWAKNLGIDLEPTPTYTHEPNGAAERSWERHLPNARASCLRKQISMVSLYRRILY